MSRKYKIGDIALREKGKGTLTISGFDDESGKYILTCSLCSEDRELFPFGSIKSLSYNIKAGKYPCLCAGKCFWNQDQYKVLLNRKSESNGYTIRLPEGNLNSKTLIQYTCPSHGNSKTTISSFILGRRCQKCITKQNSTKRKKLPEKYIDEILSTNFFPTGTKIEHKEGKRYLFFCPVCCIDTYSQNGIGGGWFESTAHSLLSGNKPCRCSKQKRLTEQQISYRVEMALGNMNMSLVSLLGRNTDPLHKRRAIINCPSCGNVVSQTLSNIVHLHRGCTRCSSYSLSSKNNCSLYLVEWKDSEKSYLKIGITSLRVETRIRQQELKTKLKPAIIKSYYLPTKIAMEIESDALKTFETAHAQREDFGSGWTEMLEIEQLEEVKKFIDNRISLL